MTAVTRASSACRRAIPPALLLISALVAPFCADDGLQRKSWTIMFYANGDNNLEHYIASDVEEMKNAATDDSSLRVIALLDRTDGWSSSYGDWGDTRMFEIRFGDGGPPAAKEINCPELGLTAGDSREELDMGDWRTLAAFAGFCASNYRSDHRAMIIGDHGNGWLPDAAVRPRAVSWDDSSFGSRITLPGLKAALAGRGIDVLVLDACLMGGIETAYELRGRARYLVASPGTEPLGGYDYSVTLAELDARAFGPGRFSEGFLEGYRLTNGANAVPVMRYDLERIGSIVDSGYIDDFAARTRMRGAPALAQARGASGTYPYAGTGIYIDLAELAESAGHSRLPAALREAVRGADGRCLISIYFPPDADEYVADYSSALDFTAATGWDELLEWYYSGE